MSREAAEACLAAAEAEYSRIQNSRAGKRLADMEKLEATLSIIVDTLDVAVKQLHPSKSFQDFEEYLEGLRRLRVDAQHDMLAREHLRKAKDYEAQIPEAIEDMFADFIGSLVGRGLGSMGKLMGRDIEKIVFAMEKMKEVKDVLEQRQELVDAWKEALKGRDWIDAYHLLNQRLQELYRLRSRLYYLIRDLGIPRITRCIMILKRASEGRLGPKEDYLPPDPIQAPVRGGDK